MLLCAVVAGSALASDAVVMKAVSILQQRCLACHNEKAATSDLRLTSREEALRGGKRGPAIQPGSAGQSLIFQAVSHAGKLTMPPGAKLPDDEIATLRAWIEKGAEWPQESIQTKNTDWWAFHKPQRPAVPQIVGAASPVDAFILEKLRA